NGVYNTGGRIDSFGSPFGNLLTNRLVITNSIVVHSVNGPQVTVIEGSQVPGTVNGLSAVRCLFIENNLNVMVSGFTLSNGATFLHSQLSFGASDNYGGGVFCWSPSGVWASPVISNCVITACSSGEGGGGVWGGNYLNCTIANNSSVFGGGAYFASLTNCTINNNSASIIISSMPYGNMGGGTFDSRLSNCQLFNNYSATRGGGSCWFSITAPAVACVYLNNTAPNGAGTQGGSLTNCTFWNNFGSSANFGTLHNCILKNSSATGANGSTLINCTVTRNALGLINATAINCIVYGNTNEINTCTLFNCCSRSASANSFVARGNFTNAPLFVDPVSGDFRLQMNSPCINAGANAYVQTAVDFDGQLRIAGSFVDVGACEYQAPLSGLPYYWLQQYGLPTDGLADGVDTDGDGADNWQEWSCSTDPTNSLSLLEMLPLANGVPGLFATWRSVSNVSTYFVQRSTNLGSPAAFQTISSNLTGSASGITRIRDRSATNTGPYFYRVGIR
ncbi:MAG: choice-of-anchor Q domain-containing protein, partial [Verrucomicrobiota bacterium]